MGLFRGNDTLYVLREGNIFFLKDTRIQNTMGKTIRMDISFS
jgi:hypothetical protein